MHLCMICRKIIQEHKKLEHLLVMGTNGLKANKISLDVKKTEMLIFKSKQKKL